MLRDMTQSVYVIAPSERGPCKIGRAENPGQRLKELQTGNHSELKITFERLVEHASAVERGAHTTLADKRLVGEWFAVSADEARATIVGIPDEPTTIQPFVVARDFMRVQSFEGPEGTGEDYWKARALSAEDAIRRSRAQALDRVNRYRDNKRRNGRA